jgi:predicted transcriptional regulator
MTRPRIQSLDELRAQMKAIVRGEREAPPDAGRASFNSVVAVVRLLTPENRRLLAVIRDRKPASVAELAALTGRAAPNVTRTLAKLEAAGFVEMRKVARRRVPTAAISKIRVEIDPYSNSDRLELA